MTYQTISLFNTNHELIWTLTDSLSDDIVSGILIALGHIITNNKPMILQLIDYERKENNIDLTTENIRTLCYSYIEEEGIYYSQLSLYYLPEGHYGWWIKDPKHLETYNLYKFLTDKFIWGFIIGFNIFEKDFRNYIAGSPFQSKNNVNIFFNVQGYDIHPLTIYRREPAAIGAFYTGSYEQYYRTGYAPPLITDEFAEEYTVDFE